MGKIIWVAIVVTMAFGPTKFWNHKRDNAAKQCACYCGLVFAEKQDMQPAIDARPAGETWKHSNWFGSHAVVCFVQPVADPVDRLNYLRSAVQDIELERLHNEARRRR